MTDTHKSIPVDYQLADKYDLDEGRLFASGVQAIARLPVDILKIDRARGLNTAAFVSGYQGSPVGTFGEEATKAASTQPDLPIVVQPGVNEELAATAVMGSQLASARPDCKYDGVLGIWYGKGPGIDRASDAIRHGVFASTARRGGVVAVVGDDPAAKSSTLPSSSDATMVDLHMPVLFPGDVQEAVELSRHAAFLSRITGLWSGLKLVTPVADGIGTIDISPDLVQPVFPDVVIDGKPFEPHPNGRLITPYTVEMEQELYVVRADVARQYVVANNLNRVTVRSSDDWIGLVACGHTYKEMREALQLLGFKDDEALRQAGIRLFQMSAPITIDVPTVRDFAAGLQQVLVIEEKNPTLEMLIRNALYSAPERPEVWGKRDEMGEVLVPYGGLLDADKVTPVLRHHLAKRLEDKLAPPRVRPDKKRIPLTVNRAPFYCSGCPHNTSTVVSEDTLVGAGIGCHGMVALMPQDRVGDVIGLTCMGNEGTQWIGMQPFVEADHLFQNLGDGTFFHSGSVAVRASIAAATDITYKLLYNGTVAMTGGQDPKGQISVVNTTQVLMAEGVSRLIVTTDDIDKYDGVTWPDGVECWDRSRIHEAESVLADTKGTTVLLHDQRCAAEKRRDRSRGIIAKPDFRIVINERICEGCGDCGDKSNCLSVQPTHTPYGRKTRIDQTSCNWDLTCTTGDCPAFARVSVDNSSPSRSGSFPSPMAPDEMPTPEPLVDPTNFTVRLSGIGGTGVVTISQVIGTAAMFDGFDVRGLDQTGLSQKAGPVSSDVRISRSGPTESNHANAAGVDCFLAFDMLTSASDTHREGAAVGRTVVIGSLAEVPTGQMVSHPNDTTYPGNTVLRERLDDYSRANDNRYLDAAGISRGLFGSTLSANVMMLGVAVQAGAMPLSPESVERAIELNGVAVAQNVAAFRFGRQWVIERDVVEGLANLSAPRLENVDELIDRLEADLVDYQNRAYARRFRRRVDETRRREAAIDDSSTQLTEAVARNFHKLMAYKDEYEVARLALLDESQARYRAVGGEDTDVTYLLHPPAARAVGLDRKIGFKRSAGASFRTLRSMKRLRGTKADPFAKAEVRQVERAMIPEYEAAIERLLSGLTANTLAEATSIANLPDQVRGFEHLKLERAARYRAELAERLAAFGDDH